MYYIYIYILQKKLRKQNFENIKKEYVSKYILEKKKIKDREIEKKLEMKIIYNNI